MALLRKNGKRLMSCLPKTHNEYRHRINKMETKKPKENQGLQSGVDASQTLREWLKDNWYHSLIEQIESL